MSVARYTILRYIISIPKRASVARRTSHRSPDKHTAFFVQNGLALGKPHHQALKLFCRWIQSLRLGDLRSVGVDLVQEYLNERHSQVDEKNLDRDHLAVQFLLHQTDTNVKLKRNLSNFRGGCKLTKQSRGYTPEQVEVIAAKQSGRTGLATRIAYEAGLRAHELLTIRRKSEQPASTHRKWSNKRFAGRNVKPTLSLVRVV